MIARSIFGYYWFGTCLRYLQDATTNNILGKADQSTGGHVLYNISEFFRYLNSLNLQVTIRASGDLSKFYDGIKDKAPEYSLTVGEAAHLRDLTTQIRSTLEAEIKGFSAYIVTPKRLDTQRLLNDVQSFFAPGTFVKLSDIARSDFVESGRCVAFELPTAAAFHLLRGLESVLRSFYLHLVHHKRVDLMWGPIVADLRTRQKARPYSDLLSHLDHIRLSFRNPTQHPDKIYDIQEVQDLFSLSIDAVNRMAKALPDNVAP